MQESIFTVGHSTHAIKAFIDLLKKHGITAICDVRSKPYSRVNPQFNREDLKRSLRESGIAYVFLGNELGARSDDPSCYEDGKVQYDRLARTDLFSQGIERVQEGMKKYRVALMCAEKDPVECHRTILVARYLETLGLSVQHINGNSRLESQAEAMNRLIYRLGLHEGDMFQPCDDLLAAAYKLQEDRIAYKPGDTPRADLNTNRSAAKMKIFTIGFTKKSAESFFTSLQKAGVKRLVDVRLNNLSQLAGFTKRNDLSYFTKSICNIDYVHKPELAPTQDLLNAYKKLKGDWELYEHQFLDLMRSRRIEEIVPRELLDGSCLLCSEEKPHHCHRRLVAEYLSEKWGDVEIEHIP
jgi:uncharacterized protein (DUF488 family)